MQKNMIAIITLILFLSGCVSLPKEYLRTSSSAFIDYKSTKIGRLFEEEAAKHPGKSGFKLIPYGQDAFTARIAMARLAQKSLDLQYYLWYSDKTGLILAHEALKAADRGVKVRILLDDVEQSGRDDIVAAMDAHPNIQIRLFNPFAHRNNHLLDFISDFDRINHRMHNKTIVIDNSLVIIGGRNIGDHYFAVGDHMNFRDLDIAAAGPVVRQISSVYDDFWNGKWSMPISALTKRTYTKGDLSRVQKMMDQKISKLDFPYPLDRDIKTLKKDMIRIRDSFIWAKGLYVWDDPNSMQIQADKQTNTMIQKLEQRVLSVKESLYIESAYFVPRPVGMVALQQLHKRGVKVQIMTNSLASNDVVPAHAGYAGYRKELLRAGVELYELRPDAGANKIVNRELITKTIKTGLHTKAMVFDSSSVFVGSFNLDPRSAAINTEGGLYIESPKIAREVLAYMRGGVDPKNSYRVMMDGRGKLFWTTHIDGKKVIYHSEPEVSRWKRFKSGFIEILPIELQL
ncbi:MAG: phospholipase D family protein [Campylobacterota bacterium]|nr:phospholipase D family protein [Campylobacterota bacterium]